jgi:hypothetical protein
MVTFSGLRCNLYETSTDIYMFCSQWAVPLLNLLYRMCVNLAFMHLHKYTVLDVEKINIHHTEGPMETLNFRSAW